ncbi:MAG: glycosyltransferase family 4 protein [Caulobacteraceae bacterium]
METYCGRLCSELTHRCALTVMALPGRDDGSPPNAIALALFALRVARRVIAGGLDWQIVHGGDLATWPLVLLARLRRREARVFLSAHGTDVAFAFRSGPAALLYRAYLYGCRQLLPDCVVLANSRATEALVGRLGFRETATIRLGADKCAAVASDEPEQYVLFAGRLTKRKGCKWFIEQVLPALDSKIHLKVAGTVRESAEGEALVDPRVEFLGPLRSDQLASLRRRALAVVVPNIPLGQRGFEGFGLAAVEGAADGGVVVASRCDGIEDAVVDGITGFLEEPGEANAWSSRITEIASWTPARRSEFLQTARSVVEREYSWARVGEETVAAYSQALGAGGSNGGV